MSTRPIRFSTGPSRSADPAKLLAAARQAEDLGYSTFVMADHFMMAFAPLVALQAVGDATRSIRLGQLVLANDFRHPAVLAKELATLDLLTAGRVEIGIGAGWMGSEFEQSGIPFDRPSTRIERLEEALIVMKGLFGDEPLTFSGKHYTISALQGTPTPPQRPHPPILVGAGGDKMLALAGRQADIIQILPRPNREGQQLDPSALTEASLKEKIDRIRDAAGARFADIELGTMLINVTITDDPAQAAEEVLAGFAASGAPQALGPQDLLSSPLVAIGSLEEVCDKFRATRDSLGISYYAAPVSARREVMAPVIERLAGG